MTMEPSGLGPMGDVALFASMLRTDRADVASFARVLTGTLADALPPGMVEVEHRRGLADRMAGRAGRAVGMVVHAEDRDLALHEDGRGGVATEVHQVVGGVVISRRSVALELWLQSLAEAVTRAAVRSAATRQIFERFLQGGI